MWFYFFILLLLLLMLLYFMPVYTEIKVNKTNKDDNIEVSVKTGYGLIKLKMNIPFLKIYFIEGRPAVEYSAELVSQKTQKIIAAFHKLLSRSEMNKTSNIYKKSSNIIKAVINYLRKKTVIEQIYIKLGIGTGDAAETGLAYGISWVMIGNLLSFAGSLIKIRKPMAVVVPYFDTARFGIDFNCIISLKLGHIINAGIRAIIAMFSAKKAKI